MKPKFVEGLLWVVLIVAAVLAARLAFGIVRGNSHGPDGAMFFIPTALFGLPFAAGFFGIMLYLIPAALLNESAKKEEDGKEFFLFGHLLRAALIAGFLSVALAFSPLAH